ncbi:hypothetical protein LINPERHAP1_LOCUS36713, partial [Linum perenne]
KKRNREYEIRESLVQLGVDEGGSERSQEDDWQREKDSRVAQLGGIKANLDESAVCGVLSV